MSDLDKVIDLFAKRNLTISLAESCTGGLISATLTEKSGVSKIFLGSIVSYSNSLKVNALSVPSTLIKSLGAVSEPVAQAMAKGVQDITGSDYAISTTGVAGPSGGTKAKPVGMVCFALQGPGISKTYTKYFQGNRREVQQAAADYVWEILLTHLA